MSGTKAASTRRDNAAAPSASHTKRKRGTLLQNRSAATGTDHGDRCRRLRLTARAGLRGSGRVRVDDVANQIVRALLRLDEYVADVLAEHPQEQQLHAGQQH